MKIIKYVSLATLIFLSYLYISDNKKEIEREVKIIKNSVDSGVGLAKDKYSEQQKEYNKTMKKMTKDLDEAKKGVDEIIEIIESKKEDKKENSK
tara:strand:+ start:431 stop:712 length:282 start_codon:yes stop_codon:yes gene_type:complete